jgi:hypothetical protein
MANLKSSLMAVCMAGAAIGGASAFVSSAFGVTKSSASQLGAILEGRKIEGELKPTNNFVLVKLAPIEESTSGGIFLTGSVSICCVASLHDANHSWGDDPWCGHIGTRWNWHICHVHNGGLF